MTIDQQANVQAAPRDQFTSPPPTPSIPIQANIPVYHQQYQQPSYQQQAILSRQFPNINGFQTQQESNVNQNPTFTSMLNNDFSSNPIMPAGLFKRLREKKYIFLLNIMQVFQHNKQFLRPTLL